MATPLDRLAEALKDRYTFERELGAGGMATVHLAHDLKHDRKVAIKVLRPELAVVLGAERFVQEIRTTANLQHPNILPLFDSGRAAGRPDGVTAGDTDLAAEQQAAEPSSRHTAEFLYYVMPYVEGETLREKLNRETQLGVEEAVKIAVEVADALDYAHQQGVIHRDIKPENILLHAGRPLVADFGIALAVSAAAGGRMTETGLSLGTPHYMSPEQATADKHVTYRSDIYSLGAVLYEMLTGEPPHSGSSAQAIILKIVSEDVAPVTSLRRSVPSHVAAAVAQALEKLPADRFESAGAFATGLVSPALTTGRTQVGVAVGRPGVRRARALALPGLALLGMGVAIGWLLGRSRTRLLPTIAFEAVVPVAVAGEVVGSRVAAAPDGSRFVFVGTESGTRALYVREVGQTNARQIAGTAGGLQPFFSPDGRAVGFLTQDGRLSSVPLSGGAGFTVVTGLGDARGATWTDGGAIVFARAGGSGLEIVPAAGGSPHQLTTLDTTAGERAHRWPAALPGGRYVLYTAWKGLRETASVHAVDVETGNSRVVLDQGMAARYDGQGHLLFARADGSLAAVPFDVKRMESTGPPAGVMSRVIVKGGGAVDYDLSRNGMLVAFQPVRDAELFLIDAATGVGRVVTQSAGGFATPRFSRAGDRIAVTIEDAGFEDVAVFDVVADRLTQVTFGAESDCPAWYANGPMLGFSSTRGGDYDLWLTSADGTGSPQPLVVGPGDQRYPDFTWSGSTVIYVTIDPETLGDVWSADPTGTRQPKPLVKTPADERTPRVSPDGRWLAYSSDESGRSQVYVLPLGRSGSRQIISREAGETPVWAPDGRSLYYARGREIVQAMLAVGDAITVLGERVVYSQYQSEARGNFDVHPDGRHLAVVRYQDERIFVLLNGIAASLQNRAE